MSDYNTGKPVPSVDPRDLDDNATVFDLLLNGESLAYPDRLGVSRKSWRGMEQDAGALVSPNVSALAALAGSANTGMYFTAPGTLAPYDLSPLARSFSAATTQAGARSAISAMALTDTGAYAGSVAKLTAARTLSATGDATWSVSFDGSANATAALTLSDTGVAAGTYGTVVVTAKGRVSGGTVVTPVANGGTGIAGQAMTNLTLSNGWTVVSGRRAAYRKITNDLVYLEMQVNLGTATDGTSLCTALPAGFRPVSDVAIPVGSAPNTALSTSVLVPRVVIGADGTIKCQNCTSVGGVLFTATFSTI